MIKVMIVDDETTTRNGLLKYIHWGELDVDQIKAVSGGEDAVRLCVEWHPDIVISDIRMPDMDGVTLCRKLRQLEPNCQIIFISGFADKENLLAAFQLSAVSFVEKPIVIKELEKVIKKAVGICTQSTKVEQMKAELFEQRSMLEDAVLDDFYRKSVTDETVENLRKLGVPLEEKIYYQPVMLQLEKPVKSKREFLRNLSREIDQSISPAKWICTLGTETEICLLLYSRDKNCFFQDILREHMEAVVKRAFQKDIPLFCAVGITVREISSISRSLECARAVEEELFFRGYGKAAFYRKETIKQLQKNSFPKMEELEKAIREYDVEGVRRWEQEIYMALKIGRISTVQQVRKTYFRLLYQVEQAAVRLYQQELVQTGDEIWHRINAARTLEELHQYFVQTARKKLAPSKERDGMSDTIFLVIQKIRKEYSKEDLDISGLAESVYLTPTYLSNLFKAETGFTIGQYITMIRIQKAKEFLEDKSLKLYQVAERCGYSDQNYFAKIFKRQEGINPSEYRKKRITARPCGQNADDVTAEE